MTQREQEDQDNANENRESSDDARHDPVVNVVHVPALDAESVGGHVGAIGCTCDARHSGSNKNLLEIVHLLLI